MSRQTIVIVTDDLGGEGDAQTVTFGLDGHLYEIDLNDEHLDEFRKSLEKYASVARKTDFARTVRKNRRTAGRASSRKPAQQPAAPGKGSEQVQQAAPQPESVPDVREWAKANGYIVGDRGRIPAIVREQYNAAMADRKTA